MIGEEAVLKLPPYVLQEVPSPIPDPGPLDPAAAARAGQALLRQDQGQARPPTRSAAPVRVAAPRSRGAGRRTDAEVVRRTGAGGAKRSRSTSRRSSSSSRTRPATRRTRSSSASGSTTTPTRSSARSGSSGRAGSPAVRARRAARSTWPTGPTSATTARTPTSAPSRSRPTTTTGSRPAACATPHRCPSTSARSAASAAPRSSVAYAPSCPGARRRRRPTRTPCRTGATASTCTCSCGRVSPTTGPRGSRSSAAWRRLRSTWAPGMTLPGAAIAENGYPLPDDCPFAGVVTLHGPLDPALAGQLYRIRVRNLTAGGPVTDLTDPFFVVNWLGIGSWRHAGRRRLVHRGRAGWATPPASSGTSHRAVTTSGRSSSRCSASASSTCGGCRWTTRSTRSIVVGDPDDAADLHLNTLGACRLPRGPLTGTFVARDKHFYPGRSASSADPAVRSRRRRSPSASGRARRRRWPASRSRSTCRRWPRAATSCGWASPTGPSSTAPGSAGRSYVERGVCLD